jgi:PAS domain S-box-containing protein
MSSDVQAKPKNARVPTVPRSRGGDTPSTVETPALLQKTIDALPDHLAVLDKCGIILAVNDSWRRFAREEGLGMPHHGVGQDYLRVCDQAIGPDREVALKVATEVRRGLMKGKGAFRLEYPCHSPTEQRWFQLVGNCFTCGAANYMVLAHQNITSFKLADQALRESEERYRALVQMSPYGVVVHQDEKIMYVNTAALRLAGWEAETAVLGRRILDFVHPKHHERVRELVRQVLAGGTVPYTEICLCCSGGETLTESKSTLIQWGGRPAVQVILQDITERKRQQDELLRQRDELERMVENRTAMLRRTAEELEHFSYALIHDLRAPLRAITNFSLLIRQECAADPQAREYLVKIQKSAERMDHLVTDALNYSKLLRNETPMHPVPLRELITGLLESYLELHAHASHIHIAEDLPVVLGNESTLTECFANLLRNAVKFVAPGATPNVTVGWEPKGNKVRVWVEDKGIGIPPQACGYIFEMFQRVHSAEKYPGTGIGLAIVRKAVERIGGQVGVESRPGQGSRFWVDLRAL